MPLAGYYFVAYREDRPAGEKNNMPDGSYAIPAGILMDTGHFEIALNLLGNTRSIFTVLVGQLGHLIE
jgi:hypothetical protein